MLKWPPFKKVMKLKYVRIFFCLFFTRWFTKLVSYFRIKLVLISIQIKRIDIQIIISFVNQKLKQFWKINILVKIWKETPKQVTKNHKKKYYKCRSLFMKEKSQKKYYKISFTIYKGKKSHYYLSKKPKKKKNQQIT